MASIAINLLPAEFREQEIKRSKFSKIQSFGIGTVLLMIFLSSLTVALRVLQSQNIRQIQRRVIASEEKVNNFKTTQGSLILLKDRLQVINQYLAIPSRQSQMYKLIEDLLPKAITLSSISVGKEGDVLLFGITRDTNFLDEFISDLSSKDKNQDKITQVSLETLSRGRDGIYRLSLKIQAKK